MSGNTQVLMFILQEIGRKSCTGSCTSHHTVQTIRFSLTDKCLGYWLFGNHCITTAVCGIIWCICKNCLIHKNDAFWPLKTCVRYWQHCCKYSRNKLIADVMPFSYRCGEIQNVLLHALLLKA